MALFRVVVVAACLAAALIALHGCGAHVVTGTNVRPASGQQARISQSRSTTLFPVQHDGKWGFIDRTGRLAVDYQFEEAAYSQDGMAAVRDGGIWGAIDGSGAMVIDPQYENAFYFSEGLAYVRTGAGPAFIDATGEVVIPSHPEWQGAREFSEGWAGVYLKEGCGFIDVSGELVLWLPEATDVGCFSEGVARVRVGGSYGYVDRSGDFEIDPQFRYATDFSDGLAVVERKFGECEVIDHTGRVVVPLEYVQAMGLSEGRAIVLVGGEFQAWLEGDEGWANAGDVRYGYMDTTGALVIPARFTNAADFRGGLAYVEDDNGNMAYIDLDGKYVWREE
jgi:hypothetical protein